MGLDADVTIGPNNDFFLLFFFCNSFIANHPSLEILPLKQIPISASCEGSVEK
jgi:hypothetical protein